MLDTRNFIEFLEHNSDQLRFMISNLCNFYKINEERESVEQDVYHRLIEGRIIQKFDPNFRKMNSPKISTYLFPVIKNIILSYFKSNEFKIQQGKVNVSCLKVPSKDRDDNINEVELVLRYSAVSSAWQDVIDFNASSDDIDGLGFDLKMFEEKYLKDRNKVYKLTKRRNKKLKVSGVSLLDVFQLLKDGYSNREISRKFGVSDMFITQQKRKLATMLERFGIVWNGPKSIKRKAQKTNLNKLV